MTESLEPRFIDATAPAVHLDAAALSNQIAGHPTRLVHWIAQECPVGQVDLYDGVRPHEDHEGCSNGYLYTRAGEIDALFTGNSADARTRLEGTAAASRARITVPVEYVGGGPIYLMPYDRLFLDDENLIVPWKERLRHSPTGVDRLARPAVSVVTVVDNRGVRYAPDVDFVVRGGKIVWTGDKRPAFDALTGKHAVLSVRYLIRPYFYVESLEHELRTGRVQGVDGIETVRLPQAASLVREYFFDAQDNAPQGGGDPARRAPAPEDGSLPPR